MKISSTSCLFANSKILANKESTPEGSLEKLAGLKITEPRVSKIHVVKDFKLTSIVHHVPFFFLFD